MKKRKYLTLHFKGDGLGKNVYNLLQQIKRYFTVCLFFQEPLSPSLVNIKTELPDPDEGDDPLGPSPSLDLDDDSIRSALILGSDDLGPVGGKLQLQMEDQSEGKEFLLTENCVNCN